MPDSAPGGHIRSSRPFSPTRPPALVHAIDTSKPPYHSFADGRYPGGRTSVYTLCRGRLLDPVPTDDPVTCPVCLGAIPAPDQPGDRSDCDQPAGGA